MNRDRINKLLGRIPTHAIIIFTLLVWILPTLGLLITSLRPVQDVNTSGWWTVFSPKKAGGPYVQYCASCHGADGKAIPQANLADPSVIAKYPRSLQLLAVLRKDFNGKPHMGNIPLPSPQEAADIATYLKNGSSTAASPRFTLSNYIDALVGYRGTRTYGEDCRDNKQAADLHCDPRDLLNPRGMGRACLRALARGTRRPRGWHHYASRVVRVSSASRYHDRRELRGRHTRAHRARSRRSRHRPLTAATMPHDLGQTLRAAERRVQGRTLSSRPYGHSRKVERTRGSRYLREWRHGRR